MTTTTTLPYSGTITYTSGERWHFCPACGKKLESDWSYCPGCGRSIGTFVAGTYPWSPPWTSPYYPTWTTVTGGTPKVTIGTTTATVGQVADYLKALGVQ